MARTSLEVIVHCVNPRPVDLHVGKPVGESYLGRDSQLDAAVNELLSNSAAVGNSGGLNLTSLGVECE